MDEYEPLAGHHVQLLVVAIDANGRRSASSNTVTYTTPADTTPPTAPTLTLTGTRPTRISVSWTQSVDNATQVSETLLVDGAPFFGEFLGYRSATVLDLAPETTHVLKVIARDAFGNTSESNVVSATTPPVTERVPPTAPTNLRLSPESGSPEIWLDWDPSTDDTDPQSQILYDVYLSGVKQHAALGHGDTIVYCQNTGQPRSSSERSIRRERNRRSATRSSSTARKSGEARAAGFPFPAPAAPASSGCQRCLTHNVQTRRTARVRRVGWGGPVCRLQGEGRERLPCE
jgi:hypothetical protein